jgi:hypothetical protein
MSSVLALNKPRILIIGINPESIQAEVISDCGTGGYVGTLRWIMPLVMELPARSSAEEIRSGKEIHFPF